MWADSIPFLEALDIENHTWSKLGLTASATRSIILCFIECRESKRLRPLISNIVSSIQKRKAHLSRLQRHYFADQGPSSQSYGFTNSHVWMRELDHKQSWGLKNWWFWTVVLEKTLESPLDCKEIKPVNCKGNQSWILIGRIDAKAEAPILWSPNSKNWFLGKDTDAEKDWRWEEEGTTKDGMVGWHHWLNELEFE